MATKPDLEALRAKAKQLINANAPEILKDPTFTIPKAKPKVLNNKFRAWSAIRNATVFAAGGAKIEFKNHEYITSDLDEILHLQQLIRQYPSKFKSLPI